MWLIKLIIYISLHHFKNYLICLVCLLCKHSHKLIHMYTPQLDYREVGSYSLIYYYLLLPLLSDFALGAKGQ